MIVIAGLVLREAIRRRLVLAVILLTLVAVALTGWGFSRLPYLGAQPMPPAQVQLAASQLAILVAFMFSWILALAAVFVAAPAISGETESGIALAVLARPLSRTSYVMGKWVGLALLLLVYATGAVSIELIVIRIVVDYSAPDPLQALAFVYAEGLVLLTLALALSTRLSGMVAGVIALILFGIAWIGGIVGGVGQAFDNATVTHVGTVTRLVLPTDGLWRGAAYALEPAAVLQAFRGAGPGIAANPFLQLSPAPLPFVAWSVAWIAVVLGLAVWSFRAREV